MYRITTLNKKKSLAVRRLHLCALAKCAQCCRNEKRNYCTFIKSSFFWPGWSTFHFRSAESLLLHTLLTFCLSPVRWANSTISLPNWLKICTNSWKVLTLSRWSRVTRTWEEWKDHRETVNCHSAFPILWSITYTFQELNCTTEKWCFSVVHLLLQHFLLW